MLRKRALVTNNKFKCFINNMLKQYYVLVYTDTRDE